MTKRLAIIAVLSVLLTSCTAVRPDGTLTPYGNILRITAPWHSPAAPVSDSETSEPSPSVPPVPPQSPNAGPPAQAPGGAQAGSAQKRVHSERKLSACSIVNPPAGETCPAPGVLFRNPNQEQTHG